ncbi:MAG: AAA family ATPase [Bacteroidales bacterium]|nr:AAA family ATPase [Bacteroidales bacterium]MCF8455425.1 AAA family ATPase [Bacteroidales bacterium]
MIIDEIFIENFKCFNKINVHFNHGVNLFVGANGSGKTAILEAINVAIGGFFGSQEHKMQRMIEFDEIKITKGKRESYARIKARSSLLDGEWSRTIKRNTRKNDTKDLLLALGYGKNFFWEFENQNNKTIAPILAYYSTQRLFKDASQSGKQKYDALFGRRNGYLQCLKETAIKSVLNEWLGNAVTRRATLQIKEISNHDLILENVEKAIRQTLILFLDLRTDFPLKIYQDPDLNNELFVNFNDENNLPLNYYSDGFRNLLYLVIDMVWRASQLNPWMNFEQLSETVFGVVTIDEIDLHLHPKWQSKAISVVQKLFPKVQFFISTHSPTVVANFENGTLFTIENNQIHTHKSNYFGKQINNILRNILGASDRHVPTQKKLNELFDLIDKNELEKSNLLLDELIDLVGLDDADINKAKALIEWQESIITN